MSYHADFDQLILDARMAVGITPFTHPWNHKKGLHHRGEFDIDGIGSGILSVSCMIINANHDWGMLGKLAFVMSEDRKVETNGNIVLDRHLDVDSRETERWSLSWNTHSGRIAILPGLESIPTPLERLSEDDQCKLYATLERPVLDARPRR